MTALPGAKKVPAVRTPSDFGAFWAETLEEARSHGLDPVMTEDPLRCNAKARVFHAALTSLERIRVTGWYAVPRGKGPFPAVLLLPGYGGPSSLAVRGWAETGLAALSLAVRGHSFDSAIRPGFPGYLTHNITDRQRYIYRGAYTDATLGVDFLANRPEVDGKRIAVAGGSQGGALTIVAAALAQGVAAAAPDVPFLVNFKWSVATSNSYPFAEIADVIRRRPEIERQIWETLRYFDVANFAPLVRCPVLGSVALKDDICPPAAILAMYKTIKGPVEVHSYPDAGHEGGGFKHATLKLEWVRRVLKVP